MKLTCKREWFVHNYTAGWGWSIFDESNNRIGVMSSKAAAREIVKRWGAYDILAEAIREHIHQRRFVDGLRADQLVGLEQALAVCEKENDNDRA